MEKLTSKLDENGFTGNVSASNPIPGETLDPG
jgi:hypothetical protein